MGVDPSCSSTCAFLRGLSGRETSGSSETILLPTFRAPSVSSGLTLLCPRGSLHCGLLLLVDEASSAVARLPPLLPSPAHSQKATLALLCLRPFVPTPAVVLRWWPRSLAVSRSWPSPMIARRVTAAAKLSRGPGVPRDPAPLRSFQVTTKNIRRSCWKIRQL